MNKNIYTALAVVGVVVIGGVFLVKQKNVQVPFTTEVIEKTEPSVTTNISKTQKEQASITTNNTSQPKVIVKTNTDTPPLLIKSIGVNLDYYNSATNRAGDFVFTKEKLQFDRLFMGYGFFIPFSEASPAKYNPQPTFILPLGTPARSLVDGIVVSIPVLWSGDYSVQVTENGKMEKWIYETEHIINPKVKVGDKVIAGQIIGEVSDFSQGLPAGFGMVEMGILKGGQVPQHVFPFAYFDPSIKEEMQKKIIALYTAWEDYAGDTSLYNEIESIPGCIKLDPIEG